MRIRWRWPASLHRCFWECGSVAPSVTTIRSISGSVATSMTWRRSTGRLRRYESQLTKIVYATEAEQTSILWPPEGVGPAEARKPIMPRFPFPIDESDKTAGYIKRLTRATRAAKDCSHSRRCDTRPFRRRSARTTRADKDRESDHRQIGRRKSQLAESKKGHSERSISKRACISRVNSVRNWLDM